MMMIDEIIDGRTVIAESDRFILLHDGRSVGHDIDDSPLVCLNKFTSEPVGWYRVVDNASLHHARSLMIEAEKSAWWL